MDEPLVYQLSHQRHTLGSYVRFWISAESI